MGQKYKKHGIRASHTSEVVLEDVRVPGSCLLGGKEKLDEKLARAREALTKPKVESSGKQPAMATFEATRPAVGAQAIGVARAAYEYSLQYAQERHAFGKPIIKNQAISFMLADMAMAVDSARLMVWRAAWMAGVNAPYLQAEGSMAKCFASDMAMKVTVDAVQVLGGQGFMRDHPTEKWVRDAKIFQIFEGTNQIQRMVIGRALDALPPRG